MKRKRFWLSVIPSLILSAAVLGLYPLFLTPLYHDEIITEAQQHSVNISNNFIKRYVTDKICLLDTECFKGKERMISQDTTMFHIWKLRFFDAGGRIVYSTMTDEINTVNTAPYFKNKIAMGHTLSKCDIDHFKKYNDRYGHLAGDRCIQAVADRIRRNCRRSSDVTARYGGEEFGVILPHTGPGHSVFSSNFFRLSTKGSLTGHTLRP